ELKDEADVGGTPTSKLTLPEGVDPRTIDVDLARIRSVNAAKQIEQGGLARAGRSHDGDEIVAPDCEIQMIEDRDRFLALGEALAQLHEANERFLRHASFSGLDHSAGSFRR